MAETTVNLEEVVQTDDLIKNRARFPRMVVTFVTPLALVYIGWQLGMWLDNWFHLPNFLRHVGYSFGTALGVAGAVTVFERSIIRNDATVAFGTINPLASLMKMNPLVFYGPGFHFCFFWEQRSATNTVDLVEMSVSIKDVRVQCADGEITMKGSARLRADIKHLDKFIGGAAAVASDVTGIMISKTVGIVGPLKVQEAVKELATVNKKLAGIFQHNREEEGQPAHAVADTEEDKEVTDFEKRFGVIIGDVTLEEILPAEEIQETMGTRAEMAIIHEIVAERFGKQSMAEVEELIEEGKLTREEVNRVVTQVMAASGNLQGMDLKDHNINFNVTGITPETANALGAGLASLAQFMGGRQGNNNRSRRRPQQGGQQPQGGKQ